jgi:hypothetical protein
MNVFLIMRLCDTPLSIRVLATLWRLIRILTLRSKLWLESSIPGGPNEISVSDHFILLLGLMRWAKLISLSLSQASCLESSRWWTSYPWRSHWSHQADRHCWDQPDDGLLVTTPTSLASLAFSYNPEKFCTPPNHAPSCDGFRITSQHL